MVTALLDACVLYPVLLRDTLLRLAERGLYQAIWSPDILEEMVGAILRDRPDLDRRDLDGVVEAMRAAFPEAEVTGYARSS